MAFFAKHKADPGPQTPENAPAGQKPARGTALLGGSYSLVISAVVLAILIVVNVLVSTLPTAATRYDISAVKLYSVTANTKAVVNALDQDVTIYWVVQAGEEDDVLENLLGKYESLSDHIQVVKRNPDVYPTFAEAYTEEDVPNNSLVVECGDRSRYISYNDIYVSEADVYSYNYTVSFDGEGAITSAIDYVTTAELPRLYVLEGHGEAELPATLADQIEKENYEQQTLSLPAVDAVPEDASCVLIYAPSSDLSTEEVDMLRTYVQGGGKLLVAAGPVQEGENGSLPNLLSLLGDYGVTAADGIVVEAERESYAFGMPYMLMPTLESSDITDSLLEENYYALMPIAQGLTVGSSGSGTVTALMNTSSAAYSKAAGYDLETYDKEDGDADGPFALAVSIEDAGGGQIVWFSSSAFLEDMYNAYSSGANVDLAMNALSWLVGEREAIAIRSKSLNYNYLTISASTASTLRGLMIGVFPLAYLAAGIVIVVRRRRKQNETV